MNTKSDNDNEKLTFVTLAAATANVVRWLTADPHEQKNEDGNRDADRGDADKKRAEDQRSYVVQRLQETAAFERKAAGDGPARKRRKRG